MKQNASPQAIASQITQKLSLSILVPFLVLIIDEKGLDLPSGICCYELSGATKRRKTTHWA